MSTPNPSMLLPPAAPVARLLTDLIGREVGTKNGPPARPDSGVQAIAAYVDEGKTLRAVAYCDLPVGASLGAALALIPSGRVDDCVKAKALDEGLTENLYEVFNVLSAVFPQNGAPRVILRALSSSADVPADVKAVLAKPGRRVDFDVTIAGYRSGKLGIASV